MSMLRSKSPIKITEGEAKILSAPHIIPEIPTWIRGRELIEFFIGLIGVNYKVDLLSHLVRAEVGNVYRGNGREEIKIHAFFQK